MTLSAHPARTFRTALFAAAVAVAAGWLSGCGRDAARVEYVNQSRSVLRQALRSDDPNLRAVALEAYRDLDMTAPEEELQTLVRDTDPAGRFTALLVMAHQARKTDLPLFKNFCKTDDSQSVRLVAAYGLAQLGDTSQLNALPAGLRSPDPTVRRNAAMLIGMLGSRSAIPMLKSHLNDPDTGVQISVAEALGRMGNHAGLPVLRELLKDPNSFYQVYAILALGRVGYPPEDIANLREIQAGRPASSVAGRLAAFGARAMLGDYSQVTFLIDTATERIGRGASTPDERAFALQLLARSRYGPAWPDVGPLLQSRDPMIRYSAAWAELAFDTPEAIQIISENIAKPHGAQPLTQNEVLRPAPGETTSPLSPRPAAPERTDPLGPRR